MTRPLLLLCFSTLLHALPTPDEWVPVRWTSADPKSLTLLSNSPLNCLILPESLWSADFAKAAHAANKVVLAHLAPGSPALPRAKRSLDLGLDGLFLEGNFPASETKPLASLNKPIVHLGLRSQIRLDAAAPPIIGTSQGVWAGINPHDENSHKAAPSGAPWIDTNSGFLRFLRAASTRTVWVSSTPPPNTTYNLSRYLMLIGDHAMLGARWVITFEPAFFDRLLQREPKALRDFARINQLLQFFESNRAYTRLPAYGQLAVVEDVPNGALLSGSILDMIGVKHTPVRPVPTAQIKPEFFTDTKMAVNVDPPSLAADQQQILRQFTRAGGTILTAPPGWRMPVPEPGQITLGEKDVEKLDQIWKEVNSMTGRRNLGARFFNVSSMLSSMTVSPDGKTVYIFLTNYSDYPVDTIAVHLLGKFARVTAHWPERKPKSLELYDNEDGTGADLDILESTALLVCER